MADAVLPDPADPRAPKYWPYESSGRLAPAIGRYKTGAALSFDDVLLILAYARQWIQSPVWDANPALDDAGRNELKWLRYNVGLFSKREDIEAWMRRAAAFGADPL